MNGNFSVNLKKIKIGGFCPFSSIDWPGKQCAVIFFQGCPWRCHYCHNTHLQNHSTDSQYSPEEILRFLNKRKNLLDGVVLSGGEPLQQDSLLSFVQDISQPLGLHTAGMYPEKLKALLPKLSWVGLDIKHLSYKTHLISGVARSGEPNWQSFYMLTESNIPFEVRTTVDWSIHTPEDILKLSMQLAKNGLQHFRLQELNDLNRKRLDPKQQAYMQSHFEAIFCTFSWRNLN